jgi:PAS domain S-box-containing protein
MNASVLVVEDNEALADNMAELFELAGAQVRVSHTTRAALEAARERGFDLAIVDLRLQSSGDGLALVPALKKRAPHGEIILVTGNASLDSAIAAVRHGVFAYVLKPFDPEDLLVLGERALAQVQLRRERESLARELAASEALYRSVVDTVEALIVGLDAQGRVTFCNRHACDVTGQEPDSVSGAHFAALFGGERATDLAVLVRRASEGHVVRDRQLGLVMPSGEPRVMRWTLTPLTVESGTREAVLAVGIDVTERLDLERHSADNAAMAAMGRLTTGLAHEIRNPLNAAKLQLELLERAARRLEDTESGAKIRERAAIVREEVESLARMLEEFLSLARPQALHRKPEDVAALLREVVELHAPAAAEEGVALELEVSSGVGRVLADRDRIKQAVVNLVSNAVDAMRPQGSGSIRIAAAAASNPDLVEVSVTDSGPGIAPEVAAQLFEPFVTTKPAGTGLGLSIVHRTMELHAGTVRVEPAAGGGTVVVLALPRAE